MLKLIRTAAKSREVQRIFVNPGIKEKLCKTAGGDRAWLNKVRPMYGHDYHFHVRMYCQTGEADCQPQESTGRDEGCDLDWWFKVALKPAPPGAKPPKPRPPLTLAALPKVCRTVLAAPARRGGEPQIAAQPASAPAAPAALALDAPDGGAAFPPLPGAVPIPGSRPLP